MQLNKHRWLGDEQRDSVTQRKIPACLLSNRRFELSALEQTADFGTLATAAARNRTVYLQLESSRTGNLVRFDSLYTTHCELLACTL
jgi:hypothetical protein